MCRRSGLDSWHRAPTQALSEAVKVKLQWRGRPQGIRGARMWEVHQGELQALSGDSWRRRSRLPQQRWKDDAVTSPGHGAVRFGVFPTGLQPCFSPLFPASLLFFTLKMGTFTPWHCVLEGCDLLALLWFFSLWGHSQLRDHTESQRRLYTLC